MHTGDQYGCKFLLKHIWWWDNESILMWTSIILKYILQIFFKKIFNVDRKWTTMEDYQMFESIGQ